MNNMQHERQRMRHFGTEGVVVPVILGESGRSLTVARDGVGIHRKDGAYLSWSKEEAIEAAESILLYYDVPFCNRVKGAGVAQ